MLILPAVDLLEGRVVRLHQGRFDRVTTYSDDPLATARRWRSAGAGALHVVDLEGARRGRPGNLSWIYRIRAELPEVRLQVGGGVRTFALASRLLGAGVDRVVLGTAAILDSGLLHKLLGRFPAERIVAALDVRDGRVQVSGWESDAGRSPEDVLEQLKRLEIEWIACTDVTRDGTLGGPGLGVARQAVDEGFRVIVAGGVRSAEDIETLGSMGASGCIIGSALYEGVLTLEAALRAAQRFAAGGEGPC